MLKTLCLSLGLCHTLTGAAFVTDGDTVRVEGVAVRFHGLDCEEMNEPNGPRAKWHMLALTRGQTVTCELNGERSYKRYIGNCSVDGQDLGARMVADGYCLACPRYSTQYVPIEPASSRSTLISKPYCH